MKRYIAARHLLAGLCLLLGCASAWAVPLSSGSLGLTKSYPDLEFNFLELDFNSGTGDFRIESQFDLATYYPSKGSSEAVSNASFLISGKASATDADLTLEIIGSLASVGGGGKYGPNKQSLLKGTLSKLSSVGGVFEFAFDNLTGALASAYMGYAGVIFADSSLSGFDFKQSATGDWTLATADTFMTSAPVPEPASALLVLAGLGLMAGRRRRVAQ
jgi:hypothetical protein